jgi:dihydrofolate synthase/folylpolyglutamate synthase
MATRFPLSVSRFPSIVRLESLSLRGMKLGLAAIDAVCQRLGRPERQVPCVLVAGTNGKGSTAATLASIGTAAGLRMGLYTSPHLIEATERVRLGSEDASPEELEASLARVFAAADQAPEVPLTYFEAITAAAFECFARNAVELSVLEVGLGGRHDATNVAPARMSLVTSIAFDHMADLGDTLAAIAREKAGVFRNDCPALIWADAPEAVHALEESARSAGARLHEVDREVRIAAEETDLSGTRFRLQTPVRTYALSTPLPGAHQARNASLAVRAAEILGEPDPRFDAASIAAGVAAVRWPGRLERFRVGRSTILLDGCHNVEGAAALARFLSLTGLRGDLIFGAMADKEIEAIGAILLPCVSRVCFTAAAGGRAASPEELCKRLGDLAPGAATADSVEHALAKFLGDPRSELIIVAGSLYLVGEARAMLLSGLFEK